MDAFEILVVVLSVLLAIFLILSIVAVVYIIKVVKSVKAISEKAASAVDNFSSVTSSIGKFVTPAAAGKFIIDSLHKVAKNHHKKEKEK